MAGERPGNGTLWSQREEVLGGRADAHKLAVLAEGRQVRAIEAWDMLQTGMKMGTDSEGEGWGQG